MLQDLRAAAWALLRNPLFAGLSFATVAAAVSVCAVVWSLYETVVLRDLPYERASDVVRLSEERMGGTAPMRGALITSTTLQEWARVSATLADISPYSVRSYRISFAVEPERVVGAAVGPSVMSMLAPAPLLGRYFTGSDFAGSASAAVILSHSYWVTRFQTNPAVVGSNLTIEGRPHTIVGIAPAGFSFPQPAVALWTPYLASARPEVSFALARLKPGVSVEAATEEGTRVARATTSPESAALLGGEGEARVNVRTLKDELIRPVKGVLAAFLVTAVLLLCLAITNVAHLMIMRSVSRRGELVLRTWLGASGRRAVLPVICEMALVAVSGAALGLGLAWAGIRAAPSLLPADFPRADEIALSLHGVVWPVLAVSVAMFAGAGLAWSRLRAAEAGSALLLEAGVGRAGGSRGTPRLWLLVAQSAATVLVAGAAIASARHYNSLASRDVGFSPENAIAAGVYVPGASSSPQRSARFIDAALERVRTLPGVASAGAANQMPFSESSYFTTFEMPARTAGGTPVLARQTEYQITLGYAEAIGLKLLRGRFPTATDLSQFADVALVNERFARQYLSGLDSLGMTFEQGLGSNSNATEIIGIVADVRKNGPTTEPQPELYLVPRNGLTVRREVNLVLRGAASLSPETVRRALREVDPGVFIYRVAPVSSLVDNALAEPRASTALLTLMGVLALILTAVGLFSSVSYHLVEHRRDYGVRAALGASRTALATLALRQGMTPVVVGSVIAAVAAFGINRASRAYWPDLLLDANLVLMASLVSMSAAFAAAGAPIWRTLRSDPINSIRRD